MQAPLYPNTFKSRTISVVNDLTIDEQIYLYKKTQELKSSIAGQDDLERFRIIDPQTGIYLIFLENSTRTKESFKNAAQFHSTRFNIFDAANSSFNKMESYSDTFKMLCGYNEYSIFIVRTKLEGVCRWLQLSLEEYALRHNVSVPAIINGGDGKHEHPTQEFQDEFTFYEQKNWNRDFIHIALIGDLYHGRTVHTKADGLRIFRNVKIDLIAPPELAMPEQYVEKMKTNKFEIRTFATIKEYLAQKHIADTWYFTRLQLERMGEDIKEKSHRLREAVTFTKEFMPLVPEGTKFYHPLPRHRVTPTIPAFIDSTPFNGWEQQALNGYYTRIIEISMLGGRIGEDFEGRHPPELNFDDDFIEHSQPVYKPKNEYKVGIKPICNGVVIDHIGRGDDEETIWNHIDNIRKILNLNVPSSHGVFRSQKTQEMKGIMSMPEINNFDAGKYKKLAAIAPECTLNRIQDHRVVEKLRLHMPPRVYNFDELSCINLDCISHHAHHEQVQTEFLRADNNMFICRFCERQHTYKDIWTQ